LMLLQTVHSLQNPCMHTKPPDAKHATWQASQHAT
jgi:hypothetical protein